MAVALRTGQQFYPHLIRTIWATEYIEKKRDFTGAAYMLGDNVATVLRAYQDILGKDQHAKAKDFLAEALHTGGAGLRETGADAGSTCVSTSA